MNLKIYQENTLAALLRDHWWGRRSIAARHPPKRRERRFPERGPPTHTQTTNPYPLPLKNAILSPFLEPKERQGIDLKP